MSTVLGPLRALQYFKSAAAANMLVKPWTKCLLKIKMAASMNRIHDMPPGVIEDLDDEYPVGVLGLEAEKVKDITDATRTLFLTMQSK